MISVLGFLQPTTTSRGNPAGGVPRRRPRESGIEGLRSPILAEKVAVADAPSKTLRKEILLSGEQQQAIRSESYSVQSEIYNRRHWKERFDEIVIFTDDSSGIT